MDILELNEPTADALTFPSPETPNPSRHPRRLRVAAAVAISSLLSAGLVAVFTGHHSGRREATSVPATATPHRSLPTTGSDGLPDRSSRSSSDDHTWTTRTAQAPAGTVQFSAPADWQVQRQGDFVVATSPDVATLAVFTVIETAATIDEDVDTWQRDVRNRCDDVKFSPVRHVSVHGKDGVRVHAEGSCYGHPTTVDAIATMSDGTESMVEVIALPGDGTSQAVERILSSFNPHPTA